MLRALPRDRFVWIGTAVYALAIASLAFWRYHGFRAFGDLGLFAQSTLNWCLCNRIEGTHWLVHFTPLLYLLWPVTALTRSVLGIQIVQVAAVALAIPPIADMVERSSPGWGRWCAGLLWLFTPLASLGYFDFYENGFVPAAIAWGFWGFTVGVWPIATLGAVVALAAKEDQSLFMAYAATLGWWRYRDDPARKRFCIRLLLASIAVCTLFFGVIRPLLTHEGALSATWTNHFYDWAPSDFSAFLAHGWYDRAAVPLEMAMMLGVLPLLVPELILTLPAFLEVFASKDPVTYTLGSHYEGAWLGWMLVSFALGLGRLAQRRPRLARVSLSIAFVCNLAVIIAGNPMHLNFYLAPYTQAKRDVDSLLKSLPQNTEIGVSDAVFSHIGTDPNAYVLWHLDHHPCLVLIESAVPDADGTKARFEKTMAGAAYSAIKQTPSFRLYALKGHDIASCVTDPTRSPLE